MRKHIQILGILNIVWGSFGLIVALILMLIFGGVMGLIGMTAGSDPGSRFAIPILGLICSVVFLILVVTSVPSIIAGIGLLRLSSWSRILAIVVSALHLFSFPVGTALGIYGLWVLISPETQTVMTPSGNAIRI